jgi:hypothetical protein
MSREQSKACLPAGATTNYGNINPPPPPTNVAKVLTRMGGDYFKEIKEELGVNPLEVNPQTKTR